MQAFLHGFLLALGLILPLGVQNVFIFNQGICHQRLWGALPAVITAALCDTLLISLAVGGVSLLLFEAEGFKALLILGGIAFLVYMAWQTWQSQPAGLASDSGDSGPGCESRAQSAAASDRDDGALSNRADASGATSAVSDAAPKDVTRWTPGRQILFAMSVSLLNPHAIMDTIGVIGTGSVAYTDHAEKMTYTLSCIVVSWIWFFLLMLAGRRVGRSSRGVALQRAINRLSALFMAFSALLLARNL
ncbi:LysE/ArgO family amino acid transporter [Heliomicrobium gestii]|uniref:LysE/ArgO family amino acid transporter n=1 Tax=Heliomicrobium gestii TaxID=2699 RepID=UPI001F47CB2E|nr:LysE family transporter [Heliomicrobium gestii]